MNVLFLTLLDFSSLDEKGIYTDLLREFVENGHFVSVISPIERRHHKNTQIYHYDSYEILKLKIGNTQKTNLIEKGISTLLIENQFKAAIKKFFSDTKFDLVIYSTPPITFCKVVEFVKMRDEAKTYLLLKDIFPENAVDIGLMGKNGVKGLLYKYFRNKEKALYRLSDQIGCMSQANVDYLIKHNQQISSKKVHICPNSIEPVDKSVDPETRITIRKKYGIPLDKTVFVYGGNLGKPQGISFLIKCLRCQKENNKVFFLIVGDGTEYPVLKDFVDGSQQDNVRLMQSLPKEDYDVLLGACDVGLIFLDHRFTIPNFPSRILSYMQARMPVLACTDPNTDIGQAIVDGGFGWWCESNRPENFAKMVDVACREDLCEKGKNARLYLNRNYTTEKSFKVIVNKLDYNET